MTCDPAKRDIDEALRLVQSAEALIIMTGAGFSADSGLSTFHDSNSWRDWPGFKKGHSYTDICNPKWFKDDHDSAVKAWSFWKWCYDSFEKAVPHLGYGILKKLGENLALGSWCVTSNIDSLWEKSGWPESTRLELHGALKYLQCSKPCGSHVWYSDAAWSSMTFTTRSAIKLYDGALPRCPKCNALARPNIFMFGDDYGLTTWQSSLIETKRSKYLEAMNSLLQRPDSQDLRIVVLEIGCGTTVPTLRLKSEHILAHFANARMIRINVTDLVYPLGFADRCLLVDCTASSFLNKMQNRKNRNHSIDDVIFIVVDHSGNAAVVGASREASPSQLLRVCSRDGLKHKLPSEGISQCCACYYAKEDMLVARQEGNSTNLQQRSEETSHGMVKVCDMLCQAPDDFWMQFSISSSRRRFVCLSLRNVYFQVSDIAADSNSKSCSTAANSPGPKMLSVGLDDELQSAIQEVGAATLREIVKYALHWSSDISALPHDVLDSMAAKKEREHRRRTISKLSKSFLSTNRNAISGLSQAFALGEHEGLLTSRLSTPRGVFLSRTTSRRTLTIGSEVTETGIRILNLVDILKSQPLGADLIVQVLPGSWAQLNNMFSGNRITSMNGKSVCYMTAADAIHRLQNTRPLQVDIWPVTWSREPISSATVMELEVELMKYLDKKADNWLNWASFSEKEWPGLGFSYWHASPPHDAPQRKRQRVESYSPSDGKGV